MTLPFKYKTQLQLELQRQVQAHEARTLGKPGYVRFIMSTGDRGSALQLRGEYTLEEVEKLLETGVDNTLEDLVTGGIVDAWGLVLVPYYALTPFRYAEELLQDLTYQLEERRKANNPYVPTVTFVLPPQYQPDQFRSGFTVEKARNMLTLGVEVGLEDTVRGPITEAIKLLVLTAIDSETNTYRVPHMELFIPKP